MLTVTRCIIPTFKRFQLHLVLVDQLIINDSFVELFLLFELHQQNLIFFVFFSFDLSLQLGVKAFESLRLMTMLIRCSLPLH